MPRRKAEAGLEPNRRAELLRAAAQLFVEKGFAATTTRDIAEAVGMRSGSPFYHFRSKQELLKEAMIDGLEAGRARIIVAIEGVTDPEQRLRILVRTHLGTLLEADCNSPMLLNETRSLDAGERAEIAAAFDRYQAPWQATLDELAARERSSQQRRRCACCCSACSTGPATGIARMGRLPSISWRTAPSHCCSGTALRS